MNVFIGITCLQILAVMEVIKTQKIAKKNWKGCEGAVPTDSDLTDIRSCYVHGHSADDVTVSVANGRANTKELAVPNVFIYIIYMLECKYMKIIRLILSSISFFFYSLSGKHLSGGHFSYNPLIIGEENVSRPDNCYIAPEFAARKVPWYQISAFY